MENSKIDIDGIDEVLQALDELPAKVSQKFLYEANRKVLTQFLKPQLLAALPYSMATKKGITVTKARGTKTGVYIGVSTNAFWLRFLEKGTKDRQTLGKGKIKRGVSRGRIDPPAPHVISTIEASVNGVLETVSKDYSNFIVEALAKRLKYYKKYKK